MKNIAPIAPHDSVAVKVSRYLSPETCGISTTPSTSKHGCTAPPLLLCTPPHNAPASSTHLHPNTQGDRLPADINLAATFLTAAARSGGGFDIAQQVRQSKPIPPVPAPRHANLFKDVQLPIKVGMCQAWLLLVCV